MASKMPTCFISRTGRARAHSPSPFKRNARQMLIGVAGMGRWNCFCLGFYFWRFRSGRHRKNVRKSAAATDDALQATMGCEGT